MQPRHKDLLVNLKRASYWCC